MGRSCSAVKIHIPQVGDPQRRLITTKEVLPRSGEISPISGFPAGVLRQKDEPQIHLPLKASMACVPECPRTVGNRDSAPMDAHKVPHTPRPSTEAEVSEEDGPEMLANGPEKTC